MAKTLTVHANPYLALDAEGRPMAACPYDPNLNGGARIFVGASIDYENSKVLRAFDTKKADLRESRALRVWKFDLGPQTVPQTPFFLERLRSGDLLPGDEATARAAGIKKFVAPEKAIEAVRDAAIAKFRSEYGVEPLCAAPPPAPPTGESGDGTKTTALPAADADASATTEANAASTEH